ncbi:prepilin peptidase [Actinomadura fulvescens]|uniref:Prepilin type IV endopeptidase peptidase domain-containing protein n=1 Tax=Actinomadura fulvescens TaxID=46160 RepID=A0ABN3PEW6_9ACTN
MEAPPVVWSLRADWTEPLRARPVRVALTCAAVLALLTWRVGVRADLPAFLWLGAAGTALGFVDVAIKRLPDPLTLPSYGAGAALLGAAAPFTEDGGGRFPHALAGLAALWALFAVQWLLLPGAIGLGDVKLAGVLGLYLGWLGLDAWLLGVAATFVIGGVCAAGLLAARRAGRGSELPYGPFLLLGTLLAVLVHA